MTFLSLESSKELARETNRYLTFEMVYWPWFWDITITIWNYNFTWESKTVNIRFYSQAWWGHALDTVEALNILMQIEKNPNIKLQFTKFIEYATIQIEEWTFSIYYDKEKQTIKIEVHKTQYAGIEVDEKASVIIALEWTKTTEEVVIYTSQEIINAFANLQNTMEKEMKKLTKQSKKRN